MIAGQDVEWIDEDSSPAGGGWRIARRIAEDRIFRCTTPSRGMRTRPFARRQDGFKAHLVIEPDTGIVTECGLTKASGPWSRSRRHLARVGVCGGIGVGWVVSGSLQVNGCRTLGQGPLQGVFYSAPWAICALPAVAAVA